MTQQVSRKITGLQFVCAVMIITLHTAFASYFPGAPQWAVELNAFWRSLVDISISTFFFLTAYLFYRRADERRYAQVLRQKFFSLVIPYLLWNALYYAYLLAVEYLTYGTLLNPPDAWEILRKLTYQTPLDVLWFVRTLLGYVLVFPLIRWAVNRRWPALVIGAAALMVTAVPQAGVSYYSLTYWLPVYLLGAYTARWHGERFERIPQADAWWKYALCAAAILVFNALRPLHHALHYLFWMPVPLLMWALADGFAHAKRLPWWMGTSFYLFLAHLFVQRYAVKLYLLVFGTGTVSFVLGNVLLPCACAALALIGAAVMRKVCPRVYAVATGMRPERH